MKIDWIRISKKMFILSLWTVPMAVQADDIVVTDGMWKVTYMEGEKAFRINALNEEGAARKCVVNHSASAARYDNTEGEAREVTTASFAEVSYDEAAVDDEFGTGKCYTFTFSLPENGDGVTMKQRFYIYSGQDYMLTDLSLEGDAAIRSNYLAPISVGTAYTLYMSNDGNRMLKVPFDNDGFGRYGKYKMSGEVTSYEVSVLYEGSSREGLVLGSVDHNLWKSAITANLSNNGAVNELHVYSGASTSETRDVIPHGKVNGPVITSARMLIGYFDDWRTGMETFADANNLVAPRTESWTLGTPFGWQSWGVLAEKNSYATDVEISDYYHEVLVPGGFCNNQGNIVFSLDAGDGMSNTEHLNFINQCKEKNQVVGCYSTPFSMWSGENPNWDDILGQAADGTKWTRRDVVLKADGKPIWYDGAYCMDPTHPYTKSAMANFLRTQATYGFKYVKMDFVNCGIVQADSYYNPEVTTAVAAYNEGMDYIRRQMDKYAMFAAFSIAPLFPYQYANSRRVACDTWGSIGHSEYCMNAISGGWWTDRLFQYNDPDHLVLIIGTGDQLNNTIGENRARFTTGAVTGMLLVADNFSLNDRSGRGWAERSREVAQTVMMNKDINEMADMGRSFKPVYGYKEYNGNYDGAENFFMFDNDKYLYVAAFNYQENELSGSIPLELLDISSDAFSEVRELWTNELVKVDGSLPYSVPEKDVRVYRFKKTGGSGVKDMENEAMARTKVVPLGGKRLMVYSGKDMNRIEVYDMQGRLNGTRDLSGRTQVELDLPHFNGMALVRIHYADGTKEVCKTLVY